MSGVAKKVRVTRREVVPVAHAEFEILEFEGNLELRVVMGELDGKQLVGARVFLDAHSAAQLRQLAARVGLHLMEMEART